MKKYILPCVIGILVVIVFGMAVIMNRVVTEKVRQVEASADHYMAYDVSNKINMNW
jgi:sensor domain CHASE-containing protein